MPDDVDGLLAGGDRALKAGDWQLAVRSFRAALDRGERADARFGLGQALWWVGDMPGALDSLERAYADFRRSDEYGYAAGCAMQLAFHQRTHFGNDAVAAGWLALATRLVEDHDLHFLDGELLLMRASLEEDPAKAAAFAREAIEHGRRACDRDLELCAQSVLGVQLVEQGRVPEGLALLDEAMAACLGGESAKFETIVFASCTTMRCCARCADFLRAAQWVRASERFSERHGIPFLQADCRTVYARVLLATGQWARAEEAALAAIELSRGQLPLFHAEALAVLAELRVAQGRDEEAERLLSGWEAHAPALPVIAAIQIARGDAEIAAASLRRRLDATGARAVRDAPLVELLGEAELALGQVERAAERGRALTELGTLAGCRIALARGQRLCGRTSATSDPVAARRSLDAALASFVELDMPFEAARTRRLLAQVLEADDPHAAEIEARSALLAAETLGAAAEANAAAALLRTLGVRTFRSGQRTSRSLTRRESEVLALLAEGLSNPEIARRLYVSRKTVEHHVAHILEKLELRSRAEAAAEAVRRGLTRDPPRNG